MKDFETLKAEIITKATDKNACSSGINKAKKTTTHSELLEVIKEYLDWCIASQLITYLQCLNDFGKDLMIEFDLYSQGEENTGFSNSGYRNSGDRNSGYRNSGYRNSGNWNSGYSNSGYRNSGDRNSGDRNSGNWNSGYRNSGYRNSGNWNSGDRNSGDSNSGYRNSGAFCLNNNPTIKLFDKETNILVRDWETSGPYQIMVNYLNHTFWINSSEMTDKEKEQHPKHETTGGYLKTIPYKEGWANMWGNLGDKDKAEFTSLPNFDAGIFFEITGIKI